MHGISDHWDFFKYILFWPITQHLTSENENEIMANKVQAAMPHPLLRAFLLNQVQLRAVYQAPSRVGFPLRRLTYRTCPVPIRVPGQALSHRHAQVIRCCHFSSFDIRLF